MHSLHKEYSATNLQSCSVLQYYSIYRGSANVRKVTGRYKPAPPKHSSVVKYRCHCFNTWMIYHNDFCLRWLSNPITLIKDQYMTSIWTAICVHTSFLSTSFNKANSLTKINNVLSTFQFKKKNKIKNTNQSKILIY